MRTLIVKLSESHLFDLSEVQIRDILYRGLTSFDHMTNTVSPYEVVETFKNIEDSKEISLPLDRKLYNKIRLRAGEYRVELSEFCNVLFNISLSESSKLKQIEIKVCGSTHTGKSTIAFMIKDLLSKNGIDVSVKYLDDDLEYLIEDTLERRLDSIRENIKVKVEEVQIHRRKG